MGMIRPVTLLSVREEPPGADGFAPVRLDTNCGSIQCRYYCAATARAGTVLVGGVGGGWDSPARDLYPRLAAELVQEGFAALRVRFRDPHDLDRATEDVLAGSAFLKSRGIVRRALVGHSFGGAVVIRAAAADPEVRTVVALATQSYGTDAVGRLGPRCSLLLLHGDADSVLPSYASTYVYRAAHEPKELVHYPAAGHLLDEVADQVNATVRAWLKTYLH